MSKRRAASSALLPPLMTCARPSAPTFLHPLRMQVSIRHFATQLRGLSGSTFVERQPPRREVVGDASQLSRGRHQRGLTTNCCTFGSCNLRSRRGAPEAAAQVLTSMSAVGGSTALLIPDTSQQRRRPPAALEDRPLILEIRSAWRSTASRWPPPQKKLGSPQKDTRAIKNADQTSPAAQCWRRHDNQWTPHNHLPNEKTGKQIYNQTPIDDSALLPLAHAASRSSGQLTRGCDKRFLIQDSPESPSCSDAVQPQETGCDVARKPVNVHHVHDDVLSRQQAPAGAGGRGAASSAAACCQPQRPLHRLLPPRAGRRRSAAAIAGRSDRRLALHLDVGVGRRLRHAHRGGNLFQPQPAYRGRR